MLVSAIRVLPRFLPVPTIIRAGLSNRVQQVQIRQFSLLRHAEQRKLNYTGLLGFSIGIATAAFFFRRSESRDQIQPIRQTEPNTTPSFGLLNKAQLIDVTPNKPVNKFHPKNSDKDLFALGGYDSVLDRVADLVRYLQDPTEYTRSGVQHLKGIILSGPPGVGKTFIAEAVAGHAGVPIFIISGPEIEAGHVGASEELLRNLFKLAQSVAPCVICIDEFDSIASKRIAPENAPLSQTNAHFINSMVNQLLSLLSQDRPGVVVIATTNNFDMLDPAIVRPGRFDRHIPLSLPSQDERKQILEIHTKDKKMGKNISLKDLAAISSGFSGAKIAGWVNEAAVCAAREKSQTIEIRYFDAARTLIEVGVLRERNKDPQQKVATATHETGHALVGHLLNLNFFKVTTLQYGNSRGYTEWIPQEENRNLNKQDLLDQICTLLGGRAAEMVFGTPMIGNECDFTKAKAIAHQMVVDEGMGSTIHGSMVEVESLLQQEMTRATNILEQNQKTFHRIRDALVEREELFRTDFLKLVAGENLPTNFLQCVRSETKLSLPPKSKPRIRFISEAESRSLPFSVEEVAKAIRVNPASIRSISIREKGGYNILFKPSFEDRSHMEKISQELKKNDVENDYYSHKNELQIYDLGVEDFLKFVKNGVYEPPTSLA